jgi:hypothetical protein
MCTYIQHVLSTWQWCWTLTWKPITEDNRIATPVATLMAATGFTACGDKKAGQEGKMRLIVQMHR